MKDTCTECEGEKLGADHQVVKLGIYGNDGELTNSFTIVDKKTKSKKKVRSEFLQKIVFLPDEFDVEKHWEERNKKNNEDNVVSAPF